MNCKSCGKELTEIVIGDNRVYQECQECLEERGAPIWCVRGPDEFIMISGPGWHRAYPAKDLVGSLSHYWFLKDFPDSLVGLMASDLYPCAAGLARVCELCPCHCEDHIGPDGKLSIEDELLCGLCGQPLSQCHAGPCPWGLPDQAVWDETRGDWVSFEQLRAERRWANLVSLARKIYWFRHPWIEEWRLETKECRLRAASLWAKLSRPERERAIALAFEWCQHERELAR